MKNIETIVIKAELKGPFPGKYGEFYKEQYTTQENLVLSQIAKKDTSKPSIQEGSLVKFLYETKKTLKGDFNNIISFDTLQVGETNPQACYAAAKPQNTQYEVSPNNPQYVDQQPKQNGFAVGATAADTQARIGRSHAITTAVHLLGEKAPLDEVKALANEILEYTINGK
jgi:hypothetical protein